MHRCIGKDRREEGGRGGGEAKYALKYGTAVLTASSIHPFSIFIHTYNVKSHSVPMVITQSCCPMALLHTYQNFNLHSCCMDVDKDGFPPSNYTMIFQYLN